MTKVLHNSLCNSLCKSLCKSTQGQPLSKTEMYEMTLAIVEGRLSEIQTAALLTSLHLRGETTDELTSCVEALLTCCHSFEHCESEILDTCGTGGDNLSTFNVSTAAAFIVAAAGVTVAKHGNRAASGKTGSADVIDALGICQSLDAEGSQNDLLKHRLCFLFAPAYHPALAKVANVRKQLGFKTIFNLAGPLLNPARPKYQLIGAPNAKTAELMATVLATRPHCKAMVVAGHGGMDELSTTGENQIFHVDNGQITCSFVSPKSVGLAEANIKDLVGGDAHENAAIIESILSGHLGPKADLVMFNAGAALCLAGKTADLKLGVKLAQETIESGKAYALLTTLKGSADHDIHS